ncbi:MAG: glycosyltransferase family 2 protein [Candidatus Rokubacteria bacterium]|nr:glycosyltransferase family 2 protein [Candidatus Rokubacteria bacterium]
MTQPGVSIVVPVYNSEATLAELVAGLARVLPGAAPACEAILVDDGSRDGSGRVVDELASKHPWVRAIHLSRNYGQHNATLCGVRAAGYETIVTMDDDLQHPPETVLLLLAKLREGYDVVYGSPEEEAHGFFRDLASVITKFALQSAMGVETARGVSALRAFRTDLRRAFADYRSPFVSIDVLLTWATTRFTSIRVPHVERPAGSSNYTFWMLVRHAVNMMTGFSTAPLQLASFVGFSFTFLGVLVLAWVVGRYLVTGSSVAGFPFLASIIAIFAGAQLFALGIIGEYLARMHFRSMERPTYVVRADSAGQASSSGVAQD